MRREVSLKSLSKSWDQNDQGFLVELHSITAEVEVEVPLEATTVSIPAPIHEVLSTFMDVFQILVKLPPFCDSDHRITLKSDAESVNIKAYRYSVNQKNEIERLVSEMLSARIIRPIHGPYASLVTCKEKRWKLALLC